MLTFRRYQLQRKRGWHVGIIFTDPAQWFADDIEFTFIEVNHITLQRRLPENSVHELTRCLVIKINAGVTFDLIETKELIPNQLTRCIHAQCGIRKQCYEAVNVCLFTKW